MTDKEKLCIWQVVFTVFVTIFIVVNTICYSHNETNGVLYIASIKKQVKREVVIALIDSEFGSLDGIAKENIWNNEDEKAVNNIDDDENGFADDIMGWNFIQDSSTFNSEKRSHGECILNFLIGENRRYKGMLTRIESCKIMLIQVLKDEAGKTDFLIDGIKYAEKNGADICNLSLETYQKSKELKKEIENSKMFFVVAAGNDGEDLSNGFPSFPTCYGLKNVISVAAINKKNELLSESNYGSDLVDIAAFGKDIKVIYSDGEEEMISGTSIAAPQVTVVSAIVYACSSKKLSAVELKNHILLSSEKCKELSSKVRSKGYLNIQRTIENIQ